MVRFLEDGDEDKRVAEERKVDLSAQTNLVASAGISFAEASFFLLYQKKFVFLQSQTERNGLPRKCIFALFLMMRNWTLLKK